MLDPAALQLPFVVRDQLSFEQGTVFGLKLSTQAFDVSRITIRGCTREGTFTFSHTTAGTGRTTSSTFRIPDIPIFLSVTDFDLFFVQGGCHARVALTINGDELYELCSGFVYGQKAVSFPVASSVDQRPGGGRIFQSIGANPAAGSEIAYTIPDGVQARLMSMQFTLVAAAAAGSRRVHITFEDNTGQIYLDVYGSIDQIISETKRYNVAEFGALPDETDNNQIQIPIPTGLLLDTGYVIRTATTNKNAADDFGAPVLTLETWPRVQF
jgi:hypothetical protein